MTQDQNCNALLSIREITKRFGGFTAVDGMSFDLPAGVIGGLIGPNGAGKTTLFNTMAGLLKPDAGEVLLDGVAIEGRRPHQIFSAGLSRTFQIPRPFPPLLLSPKKGDWVMMMMMMMMSRDKILVGTW